MSLTPARSSCGAVELAGRLLRGDCCCGGVLLTNENEFVRFRESERKAHRILRWTSSRIAWPDVERHLHMLLSVASVRLVEEVFMSAAQVHVRHMMDRIEQSYSEPITLHSLAVELHRQGAYLGAMFRREVGVPMRQWLTRVRLDHAAALVREGVKVEAVSMLVGYRSKKNFYRQFKRRFGTTPFAHGIAARDGADAMDQEAGACRHAGSIAERNEDRAVSA
jgi:AraC-like DNA-binding protein